MRVLEVSPDLGADLAPAVFDEARRLVTCPLVELGQGEWRPAEIADHPTVHGRMLGCMVVHGLIVRDTLLAGRVCTHLYGPRDLLGMEDARDASLPVAARWMVPASAQVAVLDDRFLVASRRWPWLSGRVLECALGEVARACAHQAISQLPRVEDRLIALFWHLADRWGHVRPDGVAIELPLTHEALGRLVGARRPTVSLGLQQLADRGLLVRRQDVGWLLAPVSVEALTASRAARDGERSVLGGRVRSRPGSGGDTEVSAVLLRMQRLRESVLQSRRR